MAFLYANNEISGRETRGEIPFTIARRKIKYLGINLTKEVKDLQPNNLIKNIYFCFSLLV